MPDEGLYLISTHGGVGRSEPGGQDASSRSPLLEEEDGELDDDDVDPEDAELEVEPWEVGPCTAPDEEPDVDDDELDVACGCGSISPPHAVSEAPASTME